MILTLIWSLFSPYVYMIYSCQFTITVLVPDSRLHLLVGAIGNIRLLIKIPNKGNLEESPPNSPSIAAANLEIQSNVASSPMAAFNLQDGDGDSKFALVATHSLLLLTLLCMGVYYIVTLSTPLAFFDECTNMYSST
ncbi:unnamed protein product [Citrullus colocynthis]|uniref:Uncharacterized protein n=1 Tax=Citrullus colocynthis TaxID=252529 RepID=A0ABP0YBF3_9ROSI